MSHIVNFLIEGLAGRPEPFERTMDRHINVFFGKTSLLKILHSAMSNDASFLARVPFTSASVTIYSVSFNKNFTRTITKPHIERKSPTIEEATTVRIDERGAIQVAQRESEILKWKTSPADKEAASTNWHHQYLPTSRLLLGRIYPRTIAPQWISPTGIGQLSMSEEQIDSFFADSIETLWLQYTGTLSTKIRKAQEAGLASILKVVLSPRKQVSRKGRAGLDSHQAYERMKKFLVRQGSPHLLSKENDFERRYEGDSTLRRVVLDIDKIETDIEEASTPRRQLEELIRNLFSGGKELMFTDQSIEIKTPPGKKFGLSSLSSGEKHLLMILVQTLLAEMSSIIIDEPEISMHVDWQRKLIKIMRVLAPEAQLIMATHSPEVMADISDQFVIPM